MTGRTFASVLLAAVVVSSGVAAADGLGVQLPALRSMTPLPGELRVAPLPPLPSELPLAQELPAVQLARKVFVERSIEHPVVRGDSLVSIGARYGVSTKVLAVENGLDPRKPLAVGQRLKITVRRLLPGSAGDGIVVNVPQRTVYLFRAGEPVRHFPAAVGRSDWPTPTGEFVVINRQRDKTWYVPQSIQQEMLREGKPVLTQVPPGPGNPLGRHWIGLSLPGIGIHGTIEPSSVHGFRSHGCVRLHPDDVAQLFGLTEVGDTGRIVYEPLLLARDAQDRIWFEANPDAYRQSELSLDAVRAMARARSIDENRVDWARVAAMLHERDGLAREIGPMPVDEPDRQPLIEHEQELSMNREFR